MKKKRVLFISSTGGHFNELQQLQPLFEKYDYHIITEKECIYHMEQDKNYLDIFLFTHFYVLKQYIYILN